MDDMREQALIGTPTQARAKLQALATSLPGVEIALEPTESLLQVRSGHLPDGEWYTGADRASVLEVRPLRISAFISKPFQIPTVLDCLDRLLPSVDLHAAASGPVTVEFLETSDSGSVSMASTSAVLR